MEKNPDPKKDNNYGLYLKYSGLGIQMILTVLVGVWLGVKLDEWTHQSFPVFTLVLTALFLVFSFYTLYRQTRAK